jgi:YidC/Oxa1 family membrane protein insertase
MNNDQKRMFLAVVLSGLVLFTWQTYFAPKQPIIEDAAKEQITANVNRVEQSKKASSVTEPVKNTEAPVSNDVKTYTISSNGYSVDISSDLSVNNFINPKVAYDFFATVGHEKPYGIQVYNGAGYAPINFSISQVSPSHIQGSNSTLGINVDFKIDEIGKVTYALNSATAYKYRAVLRGTSREEENRQIRHFAYFTQDLDDMTVGDTSEDDGKVRWIGIDFNFHLFAMTFTNPEAARLVSTENGEFKATLVNELKSLNGSIVFTKKNYDHLILLGDKLNLSIDFGVFSILAVPLLRGLQWIYNYIPNYGWAIILLTLIIRSIMFPLQFKSFRSMKKMQKIQPELTKLKEKYKDDPQRMQKETMAAFKKAGANPLGGCLPLIAQMPIFFAFYQVLYNAEEFVGSPFIGWIVDLSIKDPYFLLPVLMAGAMFVQTRLNPSPTADPTQKKVMLIMPLVFGFIMKDLPAGLNLYMFTSTIYGVGQQLLVYKLSD